MIKTRPPLQSDYSPGFDGAILKELTAEDQWLSPRDESATRVQRESRLDFEKKRAGFLR